VVLLDAQLATDAEGPGPGVDGPAPDADETRRQFVYDLARLHGVSAGRLDELGEGGTVSDGLAAAGIGQVLPEAELHERYLTFASASAALHGYRPPGTYPGAVRLITAGPGVGIAERWRAAVAGSFEHIAVPGDHYAIFDAANLPAVVRAIETAMATVTVTPG
jgi:hypothetical protein